MIMYRRLILIVLMFGIPSGCRGASTPRASEGPSAISTNTLVPSPEPTATQPTLETRTPVKAEALLDIPDVTESVAVARDGAVITAAVCSGRIYRIDAAGASSIIGRIPFTGDTTACDRFSALGVAVADDGVIWVVVASSDPHFNGIWRIRADGSADLAYPMDPTTAPLPNDLVVDSSDVLYITESTNGSIWRASPGSEAHQWLASDLLAPPIAGIGANGIAFRDNNLYVGNYGKGTVIQIPVESDGSPGTPVIFGSGFSDIDGIDFDPSGKLLCVSPDTQLLMRIRPNGKPEIIMNLMTMGIVYPTGIAVSQMAGESNLVYISDFGIFTSNIYETVKADIYRLNIYLNDN